jgi:lysophospholipase L1-like esterase
MPHPRPWLLCLLLSVLLIGCGGPEFSPLSADARILAFGDSLTRGTGAAEGKGYPEVLAELTGREVINAGIPGERSGEGRERLPALLEAHRPDLVVLVHGGNDMLRRRPAARTREHVAAMLAQIRDHGAEAVVLGVPGPSLTLSAPGWYEEVAAEAGVPVDSDLLPRLIRDPALKSDRVHLDATGYRRMAEGVRDLLQDAGALPGGS